MVYLLHFNNPVGRSRHYLGSTNDLPKRVQRHRRGDGAVLTRELKRRGGTFNLARTWDGLRETEKQLKKQKNGPRFCFFCKEIRDGVL